MGLDIYLEKCTNWNVELRKQEEYQKRSEVIWAEYPDYGQMTDEQKEEARERTDTLATSMELDKWGSSKLIEKIELDDTQYPDHLFKIGYFRSSYNDGGINSFAVRQGLPTLFDIFDVSVDEYYVSPDWNVAHEKTRRALEQYRSICQEGMTDVFEVSPNMFGPSEKQPLTSRDALVVYRQEKQDHKGTHQCYSKHEGTFFHDGIKVVGLIPGEFYGRPCCYVIYQAEEPEWYTQAIEIVLRTIEYVLAQPDLENYRLCWSG